MQNCPYCETAVSVEQLAKHIAETHPSAAQYSRGYDCDTQFEQTATQRHSSPASSGLSRRAALITVGTGLAGAALGMSDVAKAQESGCNPCILGGDEIEGTLRIEVDDGNIAVFRYDGTEFIGQYYFGGSSGDSDASDTVIYADGDIFDVSGSSGGWAGDRPNDELSVADQYKLTDGAEETVVTEFQDPGTGLELTQRITYVSETEFYDLEWDIKNPNDGNGTVPAVRLLHGADTYLAGGDFGIGFWEEETDTIGVKKGPDNFDVDEEQQLRLRGITDPSAYQSDFYSNIEGSLNQAELTNNVDEGNHDNGYALEWRRDSIADGETWTVNARESFSQASVVTTPPGSVQSSGEPVDLSFSIQNVGSESANVSFTTSGPSDWATETPSDRTIDADSTEPVTVTTDPDGAAATGLYDITLTTTADGGSSDSGTAQVEISEADPVGLGEFEVVAITDETPTEVAVDESFRVQYTVENVGEETGRQSVGLEIAGTEVATKPDTLTPGQSVTNSFTDVTLPQDMEPGDTVELTIRTNNDTQTQNLTITGVQPPVVTVADYANENGVVEVTGVSDAISDWQSGDIGIGLVSDVIAAWQSGNPVT